MLAIVEAISLIMSGNYKLIENPNNQMSYYSFPTSKGHCPEYETNLQYQKLKYSLKKFFSRF